MRKVYLKILIGFVALLWIIYFIQSYVDNRREPFVPRLKEFYRPCVRNMNQRYEHFMNNYGPNVVMVKLKKWNIY
jgi:hypothetical protein